MYFTRPNLLVRKIYPSALWRVQLPSLRGGTGRGSIFLTFDDGPIPEVTPQVLAILKEHHAKATFFCIGANIEKHPEVFRQIISEGHSIGNHTYNHLNGWKTKTKEYLENIEKCNVQIGRYADVQMKTNPHISSSAHSHILFRPPYGRMKLSQYSLLSTQYSVVMWDVLSGDFDEKTSKEKCLKNVLSNTREGSIIVFHDSVKAKEKLFYVLPKVLEHFGEKGFEFLRLNP
ncbi:MAG: polysaccharide deacetylase family protein [Bacteroidetes bacterium]|nr:polysaccharide deacetylase family protein [Bacteroidota bacterium]